MLINQVELSGNKIKIEVDANLALKFLVSGINISRSNIVFIPKSKIYAELIEPLKRTGIEIDTILQNSFNQIPHQYSLSEAEIDGWAFLITVIETENIKVLAAKYLSTIFGRSIACSPDLKNKVISLIKKFRTVAKKANDLDFYDSLTSDLKFYSV